MSIMYLDRAVLENITEAGIRKIIDASRQVSKYGKLQDYYEGKHAILTTSKKDCAVPDNKLVTNLPKVVTDTATGHFIGNPIIYSSQNDAFLQKLQDIFDYNDEQDHNFEVAKKASIKGICYEMLYMDEDANIRFAKVEPDNLVLIKESDHGDILAAIRTSSNIDLDGNTHSRIEFWTWTETWIFKSRNSSRLELVDVAEHYWHDVPFVEFPNNDELLGDFEGIISLVDAYNRVQSNTANLFQYNDEALLKIRGLGDVDSGDVRSFKEKGAISLEVGGDVEWLQKNIDDAALENFKTRLYKDILMTSLVPNMADENFANNASGVAMDFKLWNLGQVRSMKERKFKKGIQRRIELIANMLNFPGGAYDYRDIAMQFRANKPQNTLELAQIFVQLANGVSLETRLQLLPFIDNVQAELRKLKEERQGEYDDYGSYDKVLTALERLKQPDDMEEVKAIEFAE